jgi:flagellar protein FlaG
MKVDLSRSNSAVAAGVTPSRRTKPDSFPLGEAVQISAEKQPKTDPRVAAVADRQVAYKQLSVQLKFQIDEETGERVVQLIDRETGEVVRQVPPEEILQVIKALRDLKGMLFATIS